MSRMMRRVVARAAQVIVVIGFVYVAWDAVYNATHPVSWCTHEQLAMGGVLLLDRETASFLSRPSRGEVWWATRDGMAESPKAWTAECRIR